MLFNQKSRLRGSNQEKLRTVFQAALENCRKLEEEPALRGKLRFAADEAQISVNDRLLGTNSPGAFEGIKSDIEAFAQRLFGGGAVVFDRDGDPRQRLNLRLRTSAPVDVQSLLNNLQRD